MEPKYIFITGGVASSLGKGIISASLGKLLQARGYNITIQKFDPYINIDPGTLNPYEHGECYVTADGMETDLDLGHYERFTGIETTRDNSVTTGRIYLSVIERERRGDYLGKTIQVVPHITDEIKRRILLNATKQPLDFVITEIGGTIGDIESQPFLEAIRQLPAKDVHLETKDATYYYFKADALKREITYSTERNAPVNSVTLTAAQAFEIIALNKNGVKPDSLKPEEDGKNNASPFGDLLNQDAINRFDKKKKKKKKKSGEKNGNAPKGPKPEPSGGDAKNGDSNGNPERRQQRQGKPKRSQQDGPQHQPADGQQPRREKPQRMEKKTFRPRKPNNSGAPENANGQNKPNNG